MHTLLYYLSIQLTNVSFYNLYFSLWIFSSRVNDTNVLLFILGGRTFSAYDFYLFIRNFRNANTHSGDSDIFYKRRRQKKIRRNNCTHYRLFLYTFYQWKKWKIKSRIYCGPCAFDTFIVYINKLIFFNIEEENATTEIRINIIIYFTLKLSLNAVYTSQFHLFACYSSPRFEMLLR